MSHSSRIYLIFVSVITTLMLASCGSSRTVTTVASKGNTDKNILRQLSSGSLDPVSKSLITEADSWVGTPYKYGGNDRGGVDCSGLVSQVYLKALGIKLPRSSREQSEFCHNIDKSRLTPGDLLFFRTTKGSSDVSHVGIFVGGNRMIHSSRSQGVTYVDINSDYFVRTFAGAGKIDQYHAMLSAKPSQTKPTKPDKRKSNRSTTPDPVAPDEIHISSTESPSGFTLTPVTTLPSRKSATSSTATPPRQPEQPEQPEKQVEYPEPDVTSLPAKAIEPVGTDRQSTTTSVTEPTPEDARAAVLNSITEKKLK